MLAIGNFVF